MEAILAWRMKDGFVGRFPNLRMISAVAEHRSLTRAGREIFLTQSALSHQLLTLESRLGTPLFHRLGKSMVPTPAGQVTEQRKRLDESQAMFERRQMEEGLRRLDEGLQRADAGEQTDEIVLTAQREHRVDQIVADAGLALLDFEAIGEEFDHLILHRFDVDQEILHSPQTETLR